MIETLRCEVLNANYEPLNITTCKRALRLYLKGKAEIIREHESHMIVTGHDVFPLPTQIRLFDMVRGRSTSRVPAVLSQKNLFIRDANTCQYCNRHKAELKKGEFMTRDHVLPRAKGGKDEWTNVVTACSKCNNKKADYLLSEIGMSLLKQPKTPTVFEILARSSKTRHPELN
jgi:5-methylcytosine-specific restriction endonuclease McrA